MSDDKFGPAPKIQYNKPKICISKRLCIHIGFLLCVFLTIIMVLTICVAVTLDKFKEAMLVAHFRDPTSVTPKEPHTTKIPEWPPEECVLPEGSAWAVAKTANGDTFNMAVFSPQDAATTIAKGYDVSIQVAERGYYKMNGPENFPGFSSSGHRTDGSHDPGMVLDLGANIGDWTFFLAHAGWRVVAVEPSPFAFALMNATLCANKERFGPYVKLFNVAITEYSGQDCEVCYSKAASEVLCDPTTRQDRYACHKVETYTIRDILVQANVANVDAFHMDIEGMECAALASYADFAKRNTLQWNWIATHHKGVKKCVQKWADDGKFAIWQPWIKDAILTRNNKWLEY